MREISKWDAILRIIYYTFMSEPINSTKSVTFELTAKLFRDFGKLHHAQQSQLSTTIKSNSIIF